jgi:hypothetical protein
MKVSTPRIQTIAVAGWGALCAFQLARADTIPSINLAHYESHTWSIEPYLADASTLPAAWNTSLDSRQFILPTQWSGPGLLPERLDMVGNPALLENTGKSLPSAAPEPGTLFMVGTGVLGLAAVARRRLIKMYPN